MNSVLAGIEKLAVSNLSPFSRHGSVRYASKKASSGAKWQGSGKLKPKHRGWQRQDGAFVQQGTILVKQNTLRFFPGLNVGFGVNGNLFAMVPGKVVVTCEKANPNWDHTWITRLMSDQKEAGLPFYKKYFNVIPKPQHNRFKLVDVV